MNNIWLKLPFYIRLFFMGSVISYCIGYVISNTPLCLTLFWSSYPFIIIARFLLNHSENH